MHHFFLPPNSFTAAEVVFPKDTAHQISKVLRLKEGALVKALDGSGWEYQVRLVFSGSQVLGEVLERSENHTEARLRLTLAVPLTQREKFEWILQKGTELGVGAFQPFISKYSLIQSLELEEARRQRWEAIIREAAEQSERGRLPILLAPLSFSEVLKTALKNGRVFFGAERGGTLGLAAACQENAGEMGVTWMVGPEGGFSQDETGQAASSGAVLVSLGPRILRLETAALTGATILLAAAGDLGG